MNKVVVVAGPTAVGKTKLGIELAKKFGGEVINADSTQVYKELDIATAKVTLEEQDGVEHHLIDIKSIEEDYSVYDYQIDCRKKIEELTAKGKLPILVGGTGLYIKAALYDYQFKNETIKNEYNNILTEELFVKLKKNDNNTNIHPNNRKRIIRALNYYEETGLPFSTKEKNDKPIYNIVFIGLTSNRENLYEKINNRVDQMIMGGLLEEAREIYLKKIRTKAVMTPIGYKELFDYFNGILTFEESLQLIKKRSRNYAKRQYTWFRNQLDLKWFDVNYENFDNTVNDVIEYLENYYSEGRI